MIVLAAVAAIALVWRCRGDESSTDGDGMVTQHATRGGSTKAGQPQVPQPASLSGRVFSKADGRPIARATVSIGERPPDPLAALSQVQPSPALAVTDDDGRWTASIAPGSLIVGVVARGFLPASVKGIVTAAGRHDLDVGLEPGGVIVSGVVTDLGGGPVVNAQIAATRRTGATAFATFLVLTDQTGRYELSLKPGSYVIEAGHEDYAADSEYIDVESETVQNFHLTPGGVIRGRVVTERGDAVSDATVEAHRVASTITDAGGRFELRRLSSGVHRVRAAARHFRSVEASDVPVGIGEQVEDVTLVVVPAFVIQGRTVVKGKPSEPVADATVSTAGLDRFPTHTSKRSRADGSFELQGISPGPYFVGVWDNAVSARMAWNTGPRVDIVDRDVTGVVVELDLGSRVEGNVDPPMEASIQSGCGRFRVESDAKTGAFAFDHLVPGQCTLDATTDDGWSGGATITNPGSQRVMIKLVRRPQITGRIITSEGRPVRDARVQASGGDDTSDGSTSSDGAFRVFVSAHRTYRVAARYGDDHKSEVSTDVVFAGKDIEGVVLTLPTRGKRLTGAVVDPAGRPIADVRVIAQREYDLSAENEWNRRSQEMASALTADDGSFVLDNLRDGRYRVVATSSNGTARGEANGVALDASPRIVVIPLGAIEVRVTVDGAPVTPYELRCGELGWRASASRDGVYRFAYVAPGKYECSVAASAGTVRGSVEVTTGVAKLDLAIERRGTITGTFVDIATGEPVPNIFVLAFEPGILDRALAGQFPSTDAGGHFRTVAAAGQREILLASANTGFKSFWEDSKTVAVRPGEITDLGVIEGVPPHAYGTLGISGDFEAGHFRITDVRQPAASTGLRVGDVVTAINGRPVGRLRNVWWEAFGAGKTYRLTLARGVSISVTAGS